MNGNEFKVLFDGTYLENRSGIGRDSRNLLLAAQKVFGNDLQIVYPKINWHGKVLLSEHFQNRYEKAIFKVIVILFGNIYVNLPGKNIYIQTHPNGCIPRGDTLKFILRIHDIFPITNPEWFRKFSSWRFRRNLRNIPSDTYVLVDSNFTKSQLKRNLFKFQNITVLECPVKIQETPKCMKCALCFQDLAGDVKFFISIGTLEPRKNYETLIEIWDEYKMNYSNSFKLLIIGNKGWKCRNILKKLENSDPSVHWFSNSCDGALFQVLRQSQGLISISKDEGFNLPVAEAILSRIPVILSKIEVHKELYSEYATFISSLTCDGLFKAISEIKIHDEFSLKETLNFDFAIKAIEDCFENIYKANL